jgi:hypothetical protein
LIGVIYYFDKNLIDRLQKTLTNQVQQGNSGNSINGISQKNPNRQRYLDAAEDEFGK